MSPENLPAPSALFSVPETVSVPSKSPLFKENLSPWSSKIDFFPKILPVKK